MNLNNKFEAVAPWLQMKQAEVLDRFHGLPKAYSDGYGQERFVYIPGSRADRVLIVAHADTVWDDIEIQLKCEKDIIESTRKNDKIEINHGNYTSTKWGVGINADDRAGVALVWHLRELGHSILITSGEEQGCVAAKMLADDSWWKKELNNHQFALEFDRKNEKDLVFYDIATKKFVSYVVKETNYVPDSGGGGTDIKHICKDICGVNLSVGYSNPHDSGEKLDLNQWHKTLEISYNWLKKENLEKFPLDQSDKFSYYDSEYSRTTTSSYSGYNGYNYGGCNSQQQYQQPMQYASSYDDTKIKCPNCHTVVLQETWYDNMFMCPHCKKEI